LDRRKVNLETYKSVKLVTGKPDTALTPSTGMNRPILQSFLEEVKAFINVDGTWVSKENHPMEVFNAVNW
jgi:hypothetical protein